MMSFEASKFNAMPQILPEMIPSAIYPQMRHKYKDLDTPVGIKRGVYNIILQVNLAVQCHRR